MSPARVERFTRIRVLGEGATGRVFEVIDRAHGARCALKQLRTDRVFSAKQIASFKDEFRTQLGHPNLAKIYELVVAGDELYLLMELIDGVDFVRYVRSEAVAVAVTESEQDTAASSDRSGTLSLERLGWALPQLARGILALHATGRIHCDLKPENILVDNDGRLVIVDFGLTAARSQVSVLKLGGTPHYMAPEHVDGRPSEASDWYAFGVILYVALTGRLPFAGAVDVVDYEKRHARVLDPRQLVPSLPHGLCNLCVRLLSADARDRPTGDAIARAVGLDPHPTLPWLSQSEPFVGRTDELAVLERALSSARSVETRVVFVHGESGIGKTALVRHFVEAVGRRGPAPRVLHGACYQGASVPYRGLDAIMDGIAVELSSRSSLPASLDLAILATMFPVFAHAVPMAERVTATDRHPFELRRQATDAVCGLFGHLASTMPTIVWIDDIHWGDGETIELLAKVVERRDLSLLLVLTHRSHAASHGDRVAYARSALPHHEDLPVGPLNSDDARLLASSLGPELGRADLDRVAHECTGSPLLLRFVVLARGRKGSLRESLDEVIAQRTLELDEMQRDFVELTSVANQPIEEQLVAQVLGMSGTHAMATLHRLITECLIRRADTLSNAIEPYHDQIRAGILSAIPKDRVARHHARLAGALEGRPDAEPEALAAHFLGAGDSAKALEYIERAAHVADKALAFETAARLYATAAGMARGDAADELRLLQANASSNSGRPVGAADILLDVSTRHRDRDDLRLRAGGELLRAGQLDRGLALLREVAADLGERIPRTGVLTLAALIWNGWSLFRVSIPEAAFDREPTRLQQHRLGLHRAVADGLSMVDTPAGALFHRRCLRLALEFGSIRDIARAVAVEGSFSAHMPKWCPGGTERSTQLNAQARALLKRAYSPEISATTDFAEGMIAYAQGRWHQSRLAMERAVETLKREVGSGVRWEVAYCQSFIAFMLWMEGDVPTLRERYAEYEAGAAGHLSFETAMVERAGVMLSLCDDTPAVARRLARGAIEKWPPGPWRLQHYFDAVAQTEIDLYERRLPEAWARAQSSWKKSAQASFFQQRFFIPFSRAQHARVALAAGSLPEAEANVRALEAGPEEWAAALGAVLRSSLLASHGDQRAAVLQLEKSKSGLESWDLRLYALAVRWRLGAITGDVDSTAASAREFEHLGVRNPVRMVDCLLPWPAA